jgi:hypothetical protein
LVGVAVGGVVSWWVLQVVGLLVGGCCNWWGCQQVVGLSGGGVPAELIHHRVVRHTSRRAVFVCRGGGGQRGLGRRDELRRHGCGVLQHGRGFARACLALPPKHAGPSSTGPRTLPSAWIDTEPSYRGRGRGCGCDRGWWGCGGLRNERLRHRAQPRHHLARRERPPHERSDGRALVCSLAGTPPSLEDKRGKHLRRGAARIDTREKLSNRAGRVRVRLLCELVGLLLKERPNATPRRGCGHGCGRGCGLRGDGLTRGRGCGRSHGRGCRLVRGHRDGHTRGRGCGGGASRPRGGGVSRRRCGGLARTSHS